MDLEEALAQADVYSTEETEEYCMLESDTSRVVVIPDRYKTFGVEGDNRAERIKFKFPKVVGDNIDLSSLNLRINYQNAQGGLDKYIVETVLETEDDHVFFTWLIQDGVTPKSGPIYFVVQAVKVTSNGNIEKKWSTTLNKIGQVLEGLEVDETIEQENPDIIEALLQRMDDVEDISTPEAMQEYVNQYLEENPVSGMTAEQEQQLNKNTEDISSLSEDIENIKSEGVPIKDKTITPEKTTFILTEQQENIVTEVTKYSNHPAAVVENGISSGTTIYYNIAGINMLNIFDLGTGGWVSANFSEYGTNSPYESNDSGAKGKFTVTKDIPKCLFYGSNVWTWKNPVINTTGVFFDGTKITGISNEFLDALKTESDEIVKSGLENERGIITPEMTTFANLDFLPIGKLNYNYTTVYYEIYLEKGKTYYRKNPGGLNLYQSTGWNGATYTPATPTGNGGFTIGNLETGTYYVKLDYIVDADDRESYAKSFSDWIYETPIGDNFVATIGDYDLIPESDPVKRKIMEFTCDLVGKTWNALGDSNTQYPGGYQKWQSSNGQRGYVQYIGDKYYMSAKNNGTGGATWGTAESANAVSKVDSLVSDGIKWDIVTFSFGTNADTSMGTYESTSADKTSLAGAMRYCIETMQANFPLTKLGVILPTRRSDGNLSNDVLKQRCELMTFIAHDYGVPVCDMFNESGTITSWYSDGLHICNPGDWSMDKPACYHYESKLEKFLLSL